MMLIAAINGEQKVNLRLSTSCIVEEPCCVLVFRVSKIHELFAGEAVIEIYNVSFLQLDFSLPIFVQHSNASSSEAALSFLTSLSKQ